MATYINPASNLSYTAKDFQTIFPELLELTKELSPRWNPSELSTEPDPGVALLKMNAILGDKLNYAIDKNILESFPMSLTQQSSAQKIYSLLGYRMHWYKSAWTDVTIKWIGDIAENQELTIPTFTMVTDDESSQTFTLIGSNEELSDGEAKPSSIILPRYNSSVKACKIRALQGTAINFEINGESNIYINNLDSDNRLYFEDVDVASNGIFIRNIGSDVYDWKCVDNLMTESLGNKYFEFGVTDDLYSCYIEFPEDAEDMIRDGIQIVYLKTNGILGNIPANTLSKFISDLYVADNTLEDASDILLNSDNVALTNTILAKGGVDPETIDEAYKNYKRIVGTFNTIVTLRDYTNAFLNSGLVSNGFVCDKTNDVQCSYDIKAIVNGVDTDIVQQEQVVESKEKELAGDYTGYFNGSTFIDDKKKEMRKEAGKFYSDLITNKLYYCNGSGYTEIERKHQVTETKDAMDAISIKLFLFKKPDTLTSQTDLDYSFTLNANQDLALLKQYQTGKYSSTNTIEDAWFKSISQYKHIGTEYADILPKTTENSRPCIFINEYIINAKIWPKYILNTTEKDEIVANIKSMFYSGLSSDKLNFGESIKIDYVTQLIYDSDERIKTVYVDNISYETHARYYQEVITDYDETIGGYVDVIISDEDSIAYAPTYCARIFDPNKEGGYRKGDLIISPSNQRLCCLRDGIKNLNTNAWEVNEYIFEVNYQKFVNKLSNDIQPVGALHYGEYLYFSTDADKEHWHLMEWDDVEKEWKPKTETVDLSEYGITLKSGSLDYLTLKPGETLIPYDIVAFRISDATQIRDEIFAKSILAGKTPLIEHAEKEMDQSFLTPYCSTCADITDIEGRVSITFDKNINNYEYELKTNEILEFYAPTFSDVCTYNNYVKIEGKLNSTIAANTDRELKTGEYLVFYSLPENTDTDLYTYHAYGEGAIIKSSYDISKEIEVAIAKDAKNGFLNDPGTIDNPNEGWRRVQIQGHIYLEAIPELTKIQRLSIESSNQIESYNDSRFVLNGNKSVSVRTIDLVILGNQYSCYWILGDKTADDRYILMEKGIGERVLGNDEYFMYTNENMDTFEVYGQGTKITRTNTDDELWVTSNISYETLLSSGLSTLSGKLYSPLDQAHALTCIKNQSIYLSDGCAVKLLPVDDNAPDTVIINYDGVTSNPKKDNPLSYFEIRYNLKNETDWENVVNRVDLSKLIGWDALSILALEFNSSNGQILRGGQDIIIYGEAWNQTIDEKIIGTTISGSEKSNPKSVKELNEIILDKQYRSKGYSYTEFPVMLFSDTEININSPGKADLLYYDKDDNLVYTNISKAKYKFSSSPLAITMLSNGGMVMTIPIPETQGETQIVYNSVVSPIELKTGENNTSGNYISRMTSSSIEINSLEMIFMQNELVTPTITATKQVTVNSPYVLGILTSDGKVYRTDTEGDFRLELEQISTSNAIKYQIKYPATFAENAELQLYVEHLVPIYTDKEKKKPLHVETIYGDTNLWRCDATPIVFSIPHEYDPSIYSLPIYLVARITTSNNKKLSEVETITLTNPVRYQYNSNVSSEKMEKYKELVKKFDINNIFNYTYEIPESELIKDPLDASSFLNTNHIYNANTICKYNGTKISGKETTLDIVNTQ